MEGIVIKNINKQMMTKLVDDKFKEVNKETFGLGKKFATNDNEYVVAKYVTNPRIDKQAFSLINEGHKLELALMKHLPTAVYRDVMEEHWNDVVFSKWSIDFRQLKKMVTNRCLKVLHQIITNSELNKK